MKYSKIKKLINQDINNICLVLSNKYDSTEITSNLKVASYNAKILSNTMKSNIKYNIKIGNNLVDLWIEAEKDEYILNKIKKYKKNKYIAAILLYMRHENDTDFILNNAMITHQDSYIKADVNLLEYINKPKSETENSNDNESEKCDSSDLPETNPDTGDDLNVNTIYLKTDGNLIYNIPTDVYGFQFSIVGATINSITGGDATTLGFTIQHNNNVVIGFSYNGSCINNHTGVLVKLNLSKKHTDIEDIIFTTNNGIPISVSYHTTNTNTKNIKNNSTSSTNNKTTILSNISLNYKLDYNDCLKKISWNVNYNNQKLDITQKHFINACKSTWVNNVLINM